MAVLLTIALMFGPALATDRLYRSGAKCADTRVVAIGNDGSWLKCNARTLRWMQAHLPFANVAPVSSKEGSRQGARCPSSQTGLTVRVGATDRATCVKLRPKVTLWILAPG